jgi:hypothetical protein
MLLLLLLFFLLACCRPDWPVLASRFVDYGSSSVPIPRLQRSIVTSCMSYDQFKAFFAHGYCVVSQVVPPPLVAAASKIVHFWLHRHMMCANTKLRSGNNTSQHQQTLGDSSHAASMGFSAADGFINLALQQQQERVQLTGSVISDIDILALYYASPVAHIVQRLLGSGDVAPPLCAQIVASYPSFNLFNATHTLFGDQWTIEGFTSSGAHSPYSVLVGVALTDILQPNCGNFCVHPDSHVLLLDKYAEQVKIRFLLFSNRCFAHCFFSNGFLFFHVLFKLCSLQARRKSTLFSYSNYIKPSIGTLKPDLGEPEQVTFWSIISYYNDNV